MFLGPTYMCLLWTTILHYVPENGLVDCPLMLTIVCALLKRSLTILVYSSQMPNVHIALNKYFPIHIVVGFGKI